MFKNIRNRAELNTELSYEIFRSMPNNDKKYTASYIKDLSLKPLEITGFEFDKLLFERIKGQFVLFSTHFMEEDIFDKYSKLNNPVTDKIYF